MVRSMLETRCVGDNFRMLVTVLVILTSIIFLQKHRAPTFKRCHQHCDDTNITVSGVIYMTIIAQKSILIHFLIDFCCSYNFEHLFLLQFVYHPVYNSVFRKRIKNWIQSREQQLFETLFTHFGWQGPPRKQNGSNLKTSLGIFDIFM